MKKFLPKFDGGQALIYLLIIIAVSMLLTMLISNKTTKLKQEKAKYFYYILTQSFVFILFAAILYNLKDTRVSQRFVAIQIFFTVAGSVHLTLFHNYFKKFDSKKIYTEIFISLVSSLYIFAFLTAILGFFNEFNYLWYFASTLLFFTLPTLCFVLFETAISVPAKLHKRWFYPLNSAYPSPQASEMRNILILNLVFQKKAGDNEIINFKVKAPKAFDFGKLFYYFINDYNDKNPNGKIKFLDDSEQPFGWYFHTKPKWFSSTEYIDPDEAIDTNNIKDGDTIICQRI